MIDDHLALFNRDGEGYRSLIFDPAGEEIEPVEQITDINRGALHNALEFHDRVARRYGVGMDLRQANGELLDAFGEAWGVPRTSGMSDSAYQAHLLAQVLAVFTSAPTIQNIFANEALFEAQGLGPYMDYSYMDVGPDRESPAGATLTQEILALYVVFADEDSVDTEKTRAAVRVKAAGVGLYQGVQYAGS